MITAELKSTITKQSGRRYAVHNATGHVIACYDNAEQAQRCADQMNNKTNNVWLVLDVQA